MEEPHRFFLDDIISNIEIHGYHIVDGCHSEGDVLAFLSRLGNTVQHRDSESTGVTYLATKGGIANLPGFAGFSSEALPPHTDRSALPVPPRLLAMGWCFASSAGGDLSVHDFAKILPRLRKAHPSVVDLITEQLRIRYDDGEQSFHGPMLEAVGENRFRLRFRIDGNGYYRFVDSALISLLVQEINRTQMPVRLGPGQLIIIDNHRCLHSRGHYCGERLVLRVLLDTEHLEAGFEECSDAT
ncbi:TauD/TfdA family dioxygenase [Blastomonas aquatica]|uniref:TauD/TfdA family dioxygenase n=1 Tax=Blastomonas aquatica TaxID=1510276 RepID=UPI003570E23E